MAQVWLITGSTRGLGLDLARAVLAAGDIVVATGRNADDVATALGAHDALLPVALDVTKPDQVQAAIAAAVARFGRIDVLVNNAAYSLVGAVEECTAEELAALFDTNFFGLASVCRATLPVMRAQRSGHIFTLSSLSGMKGMAGASAYCASKFAVEGFSESLADEIAPLGIKLTIVQPGAFRTDFVSDKSVRYAQATIPDYDATAGASRRFTNALDGSQSGDPVKLAKAFLLLASLEKPPLRFAAGEDAVAVMETVLVDKRESLDSYADLSASLAF